MPGFYRDEYDSYEDYFDATGGATEDEVEALTAGLSASEAYSVLVDDMGIDPDVAEEYLFDEDEWDDGDEDESEGEE